jgi:hypothetical protein
MKVKVGDIVEGVDFERGTVVAMTQQWCIYKSIKDDVEFALPWDAIYVPVEPSGGNMSSIESKDISYYEQS